MCIDFMNLNKACLKDFYSLQTSRLYSRACTTLLHGCLLRIPLDIYGPIRQREYDVHLLDRGVQLQNDPFGLKNTGATYQHLMDQIFASQRGINLEVYIDDSIVKRRKE